MSVEEDTTFRAMIARLRQPTTYEEQKEAYAYLAPRYDAALSYAVSHEVAVDRLLRRLPAAAVGSVRILDAGCGTGRAAEYARRQQGGSELCLVGVDYSAEMLDVAENKHVFDMTVLADITQPFSITRGETDGETGASREGHEEELCDGALIISVLVENHVGPEILPLVMRHVKPGGFAVCSVRPDSLKKLRKQYDEMILEAGCTVVAEEEGAYSRGSETAIYLELLKQ